jgi:hypothetical protein
MPTLRRVHLLQRREIRPHEAAGQPHDRWPEAAMHIGNLASNEATDENVA